MQLLVQLMGINLGVNVVRCFWLGMIHMLTLGKSTCDGDRDLCG